MRKRSTLFLLLVSCFAAHAEPFPDPLTLDYALSLADGVHPELEIIEQNSVIAQANNALTESAFGFRTGVEARLRWIEPPEAMLQYGRDDHAARLYLNKPLYDFGKTGHLVQSTRLEQEAALFQVLSVKQKRRLDIMTRYFEVVLADMAAARDSENMATGFIRYDRARERQQLGQLAEIDVLKLNSEYQVIRSRYFTSANKQRVTRALLASALNRPENLPAKLLVPAMKKFPKKPPEMDKLQQETLQNNLALKTLNAKLLAAEQRLQAAQGNRWPLIEAEVETGVYSRDIGANDVWRAGVKIQAPLYLGGKFSADIAKARAEYHQLQAQQEQLKRDITQAVLELSLAIETLGYQQEEDASRSEYRELYLDRARTLYDLEVNADLGDAMVELSDASLKTTQTNYQLALTWAKLEALTNTDLTGE